MHISVHDMSLAVLNIHFHKNEAVVSPITTTKNEISHPNGGCMESRSEDGSQSPMDSSLMLGFHVPPLWCRANDLSSLHVSLLIQQMTDNKGWNGHFWAALRIRCFPSSLCNQESFSLLKNRFLGLSPELLTEKIWERVWKPPLYQYLQVVPMKLHWKHHRDQA